MATDATPAAQLPIACTNLKTIKVSMSVAKAQPNDANI